jgi:cell division protease FtsH
LGYTIQRPTEDHFLLTEEELENKMAVLLGGRAAERLVFGKVSTGAANDLAKVSDIARSYVAQYGMVGELGEVAYDRSTRNFCKAGSRPAGSNAAIPRTRRARSTAPPAKPSRVR